MSDNKTTANPPVKINPRDPEQIKKDKMAAILAIREEALSKVGEMKDDAAMVLQRMLKGEPVKEGGREPSPTQSLDAARYVMDKILPPEKHINITGSVDHYFNMTDKELDQCLENHFQAMAIERGEGLKDETDAEILE